MAKRQRGDDQAGVPLVRFEPRSKAQEQARRMAEACQVLFLTGQAGVGKTAAAVGLALSHAVPQRLRVAVCRPAVGPSQTLGFMKGDLNQKYGMWAAPVMECAAHFVLGNPAEHLEMLPLEFVQGRTLQYAVLDEAQNCTVDELEAFLTRLGKGGKLFISGDPQQSVIGNRSGLQPWLDALEGLEGVGQVRFPPGESMRSPIIEAIIRRRPR